MFHHPVRIDAEPGLSLRLGLEASPDVHAAGIEPREEGLLLLVRTVDKVERGLQKLVVDGFHAFLGERASVVATLLAPLPEPRIFAGGLGDRRSASQHAARAKA